MYIFKCEDYYLLDDRKNLVIKCLNNRFVYNIDLFYDHYDESIIRVYAITITIIETHL